MNASVLPTRAWVVIAAAGLLGALAGCAVEPLAEADEAQQRATSAAAPARPARPLRQAASSADRPPLAPTLAADPQPDESMPPDSKPEAAAGKSNAVKSGVVKSDTAKSEAVKSEAVKSNAVKSNAVKSNAVKSEAVAIEPALPNESAAEQDSQQVESLQLAELPAEALPAVGAPSFGFSADAAGRLLTEQFALPVPVAEPASAARPREHTWTLPAERMPREQMPAADLTGARVVPLELAILPHARPAVDLSELSSESDPPRPQRAGLPLAPRSRIVGPAPESLPALAPQGRMPSVAVNLEDDATAAPLLVQLLAPLGALRTSGAPFVKPTPLDPAAERQDLDLRSPPIDSDPPARSTAPLPSPTFP